MIFDARLCQTTCKVLTDSGAYCKGAADGCITHDLVRNMSLSIRQSNTASVRLANGSSELIEGSIITTLRIGSFQDTVKLLVLKQGLPGVEVILAND